jgi:4-amino-4-deoxy-L-arabinose transferase-like glycosyltransferase
MLPAYRLARGGSVETQLYSVRAWGIGVFMLLILAAWRLARESFPRAAYLQIAVPLMLIFHPQLGFIFSGVNNDGLLVLFFTVWLLELVRLARGDLSGRRAALLGVVTGLGMLTKSTFILVYPLTLGVMAVMMVRRRPDRARIARAAGIVLGVSLLICGWYYLRGMLNGVPPLLVEKVERYGQPGLFSLLFSTHFTADLLDSFIGTFSWMSIPMLASVTTWFRRLVWLAGIGVAVSLGLDYFRRREQVIEPWLAGLFTVVAGSLFLFSAVYELKLGAAQGRYLFPAVFPFWALFLVGLTGWLPASWRPRGVALVVAAAAVFCTWALLGEFLPRVT